ncbi:MAG: pitrilysin family protein [candidate division WOR-3 bacterium]
MKKILLILTLSLVSIVNSKESPMAREIKKMKFKPLQWTVPTVGKDIEKLTLPSGTTVYLKENHDLPLVEITVYVKGGAAYLGHGEKLIPELLVNSMVKGGTSSFKPEEIIDSIEINAIRIDQRAEDEYITYTFTFQTKYTPLALKIMDEILFYPTFCEEEVEKEKAKIEDNWERYIEDANNLLNEATKKIVFSGNPLSTKPNLEKIKNIRGTHLKEIHGLFFQPKNMVISVVGDFNGEALKEQLKNVFSEDKNNAKELTLIKPGELAQRKVYFVQKNVPQGYIYFVQDIPSGYFEEVYPLILVGDILGGGFNSKIVSKVRNELGLAYDTYAYFSTLSNMKGVFYAFSATRSDALDQAIYHIEDAIKQMVEGNITQAELDFSKESFLSSTVTSIRSDWAFVQRLALRSLFGYPDDYFVRLREHISNQNLNDIKRVSSTYLKLDKMAIIVVGDSTQIDLKKLEKFGTIEILEY